MSHWTCEHCGGRFRDEHVCAADPEVTNRIIDDMQDQIDDLKARLATIEEKLGLNHP